MCHFVNLLLHEKVSGFSSIETKHWKDLTAEGAEDTEGEKREMKTG
jgi:hypothetical protein